MQHGSVPKNANIAPHSASVSLLWYSFSYLFGSVDFWAPYFRSLRLGQMFLMMLWHVILIRRQACLAKIAVEAPGPAVPSDEDFVTWQIDSLVAASKRLFFAGPHEKKRNKNTFGLLLLPSRICPK